MTQGLRTTITLAVLAALLVAGLAWGWSAATTPLPDVVEASDCTETPVAAGEKVYADQVLVSVLNAGDRSGLASDTMKLLVDRGFVFGERGNAPSGTEVARAEIWAADPDGPQARLVATWLGKGTEIRTHETTAEGIVVVVGDEFRRLARGRKAVAATTDTTICVPPPALPDA